MTERHDDDRDLQSLFDRAGPRPDLPEEDLASLRSTARQAWIDSLEQERPETTSPRDDDRAARPWRPRVAAAAVLLSAVAGLALWLGGGETPSGPTQSPPPVVASLVSGELERLQTPGIGTRTGRDREVVAGSEVGSSDTGALTLRLAHGPSLRLDRSSRVRIETSTRIELLEGAAYLDSAQPGPAVTIVTPAGEMREVGTQFEVRRVEPDVTRVRVREGAVVVSTDGSGADAAGGTLGLESGRQLLLSADAHSISPVPRTGPEWQWVIDAAPPFGRNESTLGEYLDWYLRETGLEPVWDPPELVTLRDETISGIGHTKPADVPELLAGAGLDSRIEDGRLVLSRLP